MAQDFFSLRKLFVGKTWKFTEGRNLLNPASHGDIAWAGALASHAAAISSALVSFGRLPQPRFSPDIGPAFGLGRFNKSIPMQAAIPIRATFPPSERGALARMNVENN